MAEIILVRHGQANSHAKDEESYDQLSHLGREQAGWLGAYLAQTNPHFDRVITGTMTRQIDTAAAMGYAITAQDARLNEMRYFEMAHALEAQHGVLRPQKPTDFAKHIPQLIRHWAEGNLEGVAESYLDFAIRVQAAIDEQCQGAGRILMVTSGGVIGQVMACALGLDHRGLSKIMLPVMNSSYHRLSYVHNALMVSGYNATPHLDMPDRAYARTHV